MLCDEGGHLIHERPAPGPLAQAALQAPGRTLRTDGAGLCFWFRHGVKVLDEDSFIAAMAETCRASDREFSEFGPRHRAPRVLPA